MPGGSEVKTRELADIGINTEISERHLLLRVEFYEDLEDNAKAEAALQGVVALIEHINIPRVEALSYLAQKLLGVEKVVMAAEDHEGRMSCVCPRCVAKRNEGIAKA